MKSKKILSIVMSFALGVSSYGQEECQLISSQLYGLTGDIEGKRVYTKEEFTYECKTVTQVKGTCKEWEEVYQDYGTDKLKYDVYYQSENFQGSIGQVIATAQGYDKINGIWSGWHGLCQDGVDDGNWDWASDPYFLGGLALSIIGGCFSGGTSSAATSTTKSAATSAATTTAKQEASNVVKYAVCAARAGLDAGKMLEEYYDDGEPCDPVDEICGLSDTDSANDDTNIFTIPEDEYEQLVNNNPDIVDNIVVLDGVGTGVVTLKVVNEDVDTSSMSTEEADAAEQEAKERALKVSAAMTTVQLASCVAADTDTGSGSSSSSDSESLLSASAITGMVLGAINPLLGAAYQVGEKVYDSMTSKIDTCHNEDQAKEKGSRHEATYHALPLGMCHEVEVVEEGSKDNGTYQRRFRYCCYDDKSTRILVEQAKAQFAKGWEHCTDMTLKELAVMSFSPCDEVELDSGINGVDLPADATTAERMKAYQFTHKCIDMREYTAVLLEKFAGDDMLIDSSDVKEMLEGLK